MPALGLLIAGLFASLIEFFTRYITRRIAIFAAALVIFTSLTTAFMLAMKALYAGIYVAAPADLVIAAGWFIPSNASACISAIIGGHVLRYAYDWNIGLAKAKLWVT